MLNIFTTTLNFTVLYISVLVMFTISFTIIRMMFWSIFFSRIKYNVTFINLYNHRQPQKIYFNLYIYRKFILILMSKCFLPVPFTFFIVCYLLCLDSYFQFEAFFLSIYQINSLPYFFYVFE
jgi:hypothetical protein